jgi:aryl-alcohol dehydrogenase-like predicted oxidoreductase
LVIATKVGAKRGPAGTVHPAMSREELTQAVHDNLRNLGVDVLDVVNLRSMLRDDAPAEGSIEEPLTVIADLQRQGLIRHIGLSNVTAAQVAEGRKICDIVCVQNLYNLADRSDESLLEELARNGIAYVAYFPLGGITQLQSAKLSNVARRFGATPIQVALAWLLQRSPNLLPIPGTSSLAHLRENLAAAALELPPLALEELSRIGRSEPDADRGP